MNEELKVSAAQGEDAVLLSVKNLTVEYSLRKRKVRAVNGASFEIKKGETLALVGETGAGKTTIAKAILRILPDPPAIVRSGEVVFDGTDLLKVTDREIRDIRGNRIAMIFQDPMTALNPLMTIGDQIMEVLYLHSDLNDVEIREKAAEILETVGIVSSRMNEYPHQFSGGMKQRVVIAMALACSPDLLLADEPTTALDVTIQAQVLDLIKDLKEKYGTSMLLITHDLGVVGETSDYVAVIYAGRIVEYGTKRDIFKNPKHPYTIGLFQSLPSMSTTVERLTPIAGMMPDPAELPNGCTFHPRCPYKTERCENGTIDYVEVSPGHSCACVKCMED